MLTDYLVDTFLFFRLGRHAEDQHSCQYVSDVGAKQVKLKRNELPEKKPGMKRFVIISDTHERHKCLGKLPEGDIFIHAGDILMTSYAITPDHAVNKFKKFNAWLASDNIPCDTKVVVAGNHDKVLQKLGRDGAQSVLTNAVYLENSSTIAHSYCIWGTPSSHGKSRNKAFQSKSFRTEALESARRHCCPAASSSSSDTSANVVVRKPDIWVTHGPNFDLLEEAYGSEGADSELLLHVWGHAHAQNGVLKRGDRKWGHVMRPAMVANASIMDTGYRPMQLPLVVDLPARE